MNVPAVAKKCVVFLGLRGEIPEATAFLVDHPMEGGPLDRRAKYLVTATHCLPEDPSSFSARVNMKGGKVEFVDLPKRWWQHPSDPTVDVSVTPLPPDLRAADVGTVPAEIFLHPKAVDGHGYIGEGDEVFITGLFAESHGDHRNLPIVRTGNIARVASDDQRIATEWDQGPIVVHLIEARSRSGVSGSPVFTRRTVKFHAVQGQPITAGASQIIGHGPEIYLLGMIHGHFDDDATSINMGIAFVIPAPHILQTLNHPELVTMRREQVAAHRARAKPDSREGDDG